ncbi:hypothetical protein QYM36_007781 [Artemia franciscana]|uniref:Reverse transcriptase domain-containing protein n=1 Tax=Artemia franciscana TaxID=6661 RepID=A0AA88IE78_ARTSF|nr:hypothetical protein QYM36_007781 [Artemia franciscana]
MGKLNNSGPEARSLRICLNPLGLNKWVKQPHYPMPSFDDVASKCSETNRFFKLDARNGYWSMELDEESSLIATFSTSFGKYRWKRYPFGIKSAQDEFQRKMEEVFEGLDIGLIIDDIAGTVKDDEDHDAKQRMVLQQAREKGVKFNQEKCILMQEVSPTLGTYSPPKEPSRPTENQGDYQHSSIRITRPATGSQLHENARKQIQSSICKNLACFDHTNKHVEIIVDASQHGLAAQLVIDEKTAAFGSRSLSKAEKRYSEIQKEMVTVTNACKHFRQYVHGRTVAINSDHKPLESILKKSIYNAPPRLQRMMIAIQNYDIQLIYRPGSEIPAADALSRLHLQETDPDTQYDSEFAVLSFLKSVPIRDSKIEQIAEQRSSDGELQLLVKTIRTGRPDHRHECNTSILKYWNHRDELTYLDGLIGVTKY